MSAETDPAPTPDVEDQTVEEAAGSAESAGPAETTETTETAESAEPAPQLLDPEVFFALLNESTAEPKTKKRRLRTALRWTSAVLVMGAVGAGTAYAVTVPKRTDIPGLATKKDGRYTFAPLARPALPPGTPAPGASANAGQNHYLDLRELLLAPPSGATVDPAYPGPKSWSSPASFASGFPTEVAGDVNDNGIRHVAATGWTTADGAHTTIWLLEFPDASAAVRIDNVLAADPPKSFGPEAQTDADSQDLVNVFGVTDRQAPTTSVVVEHFTSMTKPGGAETGQTGRFAHFNTGDVTVVVETTAPQAVTDVPTDQIVTLQAELLR